ncbi:MAG: DUF4032 domain-containing protein [Chloroflexi bacterium]|nr:DUF4032 domain-containing protein [Chloroflexota bacterium]
MTTTLPRLRLREPTPELLDLPWEEPLAEWTADGRIFRTLPVGPSRHLVRFLVTERGLIALKEEPAAIADREYDILRHLEDAGLPAVIPMGVAGDPSSDAAILVTRYLPNSLQYRLLLSRVPPGPAYLRDQLLDAMAGLLVELHRAGVYWGDCSLANTLFRRDGNLVQAYLVDAETAELHPSLSDGQRAYDLEVLVENVAYGLADLAAMHDRADLVDDAFEAAESVRDRYLRLWEELAAAIEVPAGQDERFEIAARNRRLNDLGFAVAAARWLADVYEPALGRLSAVVGPGGDAVQAYCDVLETKWLQSEQARRDVGLERALEAYLTSGAAGPEISGAIGALP